MSVFLDSAELIQFAEALLVERKKSLSNDIRRCLAGDSPAPFPALLYCFSVVDMMGILFNGDASDRPARANSAMAEDFMKRFMGYSQRQIDMLQKIFRHKIVHLSQPAFVKRYNGKKIAWREYHDKRNEHLKIEENLPLQEIPPPAGIPVHLLTSSIQYDAAFTVSIVSFEEDICRGIDEYIKELKRDNSLQNKFESAIITITGI